MKKTLYLIDKKLHWRVFKKLQEKLVKDTGPTPKEADKILWEMMRDGQILCGFRKDMPGDMWVGLKLPKGFQISLIKNPK